jgi:hypothetical protein
MAYVDDGIFLGSDDLQLQEVIKEIYNLGLNNEDQCHPADYVGIDIKKLKDGSYELTQQALIDSIINDVRMQRSNQSQLKCHYNSTHLRTNLLLISTSTTGLQLAS